MSVLGHIPSQAIRAGERSLIAGLGAASPLAGPNSGIWARLTVYRYPRTHSMMWTRLPALSLIIVAQGRLAITVGARTYIHRPFEYLVFGSHTPFQAEIFGASPSRPFLSVALRIDPALVRQVAGDMPGQHGPARRSRQLPAAAAAAEQAFSSPVDQELLDVVLRLLKAAGAAQDRHVLPPLYLREMIFRLLQREQSSRLQALAAAESAGDRVSVVLDYLRDHLAEPLTVADMADLASLSPSAFAHLFRDVTGHPPYQFLKEMRLDRARVLLIDGGFTIARVAKEVGYPSVSNFIREFRGRYGITPHAYRDANTVRSELDTMHADT